MKRQDIGIGIGLFVLSAWLFWYVGRYGGKEVYGYGPDFFPRVLAVIMAILSLALIVQACRSHSLKMADRIDPKGFVRMLISVAICIGYLFLTKFFGFATATFVFLFTLMTFLKQKGVVVRILSSLATSVTVWVILRYFLIIPLPEGLLF